MFKRILKLSLVLSVLAIFAGGCTFPWKQTAPAPLIQEPVVSEATTTAPTVSNTNQLKKFNNYEELSQFLIENNNPETSGSVVSESATASGDSSTPNNSLDYSKTNNQVAGVDEADIIKTDGIYIYALVRNELSIIKATPAAEAATVSKITFQSRPQDIFINGNFLAVFGSDSQIYAQPLYKTFRRQNVYSFFKVFDLSDPANPKQVRDLDFEGSYYDARLVGDYVYFLTNTYGSYLANEPLVPRVLENGQVLSAKCDSTVKCFAPEVYYFDIPYDSYNFTNITAINIKNNAEAINSQVYLLNNSQNLYVSQNNIYITYTQYLNEYDLEQLVKKELLYPKLAAADQDKVNKIETAPLFILNNNEKKYKIAQIVDRYLASLSDAEQTAFGTETDEKLKQKLIEKEKEMEKTVIHKIAINGNKIEYRAMGEVNGQILNQFSLDENGGNLRLATTKNQTWSRLSDQAKDSYSNIYVLDANLKPLGSLENLATTEKIYAARFIGDRAYLVTFKQTDPLFVISLKDPAKPAVLGAIKIPGFSNYLQPIDKDGNKLIGLGRDIEETADGGVKVKGLKLSLFDFTDLSKPKEADSYLLGVDSDSIALSDHEAFLYSAEKNLLSIPAVLRDNGRLAFAGALVFTINNDSFSLKGKIDHSAAGHFSQSDSWDGFNYYDNTVKRSLYINDNLITFSNKFLKINDLATLSEVKSLELTAGGDDYIITPMPSASGSAESSAGDIVSPESPLPETGLIEGAAITSETGSTTPLSDGGAPAVVAVPAATSTLPQ